MNDLKEKMKLAQNADVQIKLKLEENKESFTLISNSRSDLAAMIPFSSSGCDVSSNPVVITIKKCLDQITELSAQKDSVMAEGVQMFENFNPMDELLSVFKGTSDKSVIFLKLKERFVQHFDKNVVLEQ